MLGRLTHYAFDAVLFSAFLAGVKRSTGLTYEPRIKSFQYIPKRGPTWLTLLTPAPPYRSGRVCAGAVHSPSVKTEQISDNKDVKKWIDNYLGVGEWVMDQSVAVMGSSSWFERRR
ncbi:DUF1748-domain-containing protein [Penicillium malachiteum]|nr:DUF1748-domain-containing protein [Penicillium malachiteum]KAJ5735378.1 DUF1748-domain-containing protein [Penicillium malachiteum]